MISHHAEVLVDQTDIPVGKAFGTKGILESEAAVVICEDQDVMRRILTEVFH